jgi:hypothetical protein
VKDWISEMEDQIYSPNGNFSIGNEEQDAVKIETSADGLLSYGALRVYRIDDRAKTIAIVAEPKDNPDLPAEALYMLNSEDAKALALNQAVKQGWHEPALKDHTVVYGDPNLPLAQQTYIRKDKIHEGKPFLLVSIYTPSAFNMAAYGDSL